MSYDKTCPIWGTPAKVIDAPERAIWKIDSPRAGGKYEFDTYTAVADLSDNTKVKLSNWIVEQNRFGAIPLITSETLPKVGSWPELSVFGRADQLLRLLAKITKHIGDSINYRENAIDVNRLVFIDQPDELKNYPNYMHYLNMLASSGSVNSSEIYFLGGYLVDQGWVKRPENARLLIVTPKGYARLSELDGANPESAQGFVAMWFDDSISDAYEKGIEPAIRESGYLPMRIDKKEHINKIDDEIIAEIRRSRFIVADFTSEKDKPRGGVYFEAGFAMGLNIPVIWTCSHELIDELHFDTQQFNHIAWKDADDLRTQLKNRIGAVIGDGPHKPKALV